MATSSETRRSNKFIFLRLPLYLVTRTVTLGLNVTLLFALTLCSGLPPKRHMNITFRHATQALPRALWRVFFLHTQICGKNIALRGVFLIDKLPPPRSKIDINMCKVHKFLSTT